MGGCGRGQLLAELGKRLTAFAGALADDVAGLDLGIVIYNAACTPVGPFADAEAGAMERAVDVNVRGPLLLLRTLLPAMRERGRGAVVLMSSLSGLQEAPNISVYAATKAFNAILAEGLWSELRPHGVEVAACRAGAMPTPGYVRRFNRDVSGMLSPDEAARQTLDALGRGPRLVAGYVRNDRSGEPLRYRLNGLLVFLVTVGMWFAVEPTHRAR